MREDELLEELNHLLLLVSEDEVEGGAVGQEAIEELREGLSTLILRLRKEGIK
ncbi:hypothetical protein ACFLRC_01175 [Candidatus Altiarchaeota archaeon]